MAEAKTLEIKPWNPASAAVAAAIHQQVMDSPWSERLWAQVGGKNSIVLSLFADNQLCGVMVFSHIVDEAELQTIAVAKESQGLGYATQLLSHGLALLPEHVERVFLEVDSANQPAIGLYTRFGFEQCGLRKQYYRHSRGNGDALIMQKLLKE